MQETLFAPQSHGFEPLVSQSGSAGDWQKIPGLTFVPDFLTHREEDALVELADSQTWQNTYQRRTQHYGAAYPDGGRWATRKEMPASLRHLGKRLARLTGQEANQLSINEYLPGQGIAPHIDKNEDNNPWIGDISLLSGIGFYLENAHRPAENWEIYLPPRSLLILSGFARHCLRHGIRPRQKDLLSNGLELERSRRLGLILRRVEEPAHSGMAPVSSVFGNPGPVREIRGEMTG